MYSLNTIFMLHLMSGTREVRDSINNKSKLFFLGNRHEKSNSNSNINEPRTVDKHFENKK